ncbi:MAG: hypothetical protein JWR68_2516, partial [Polaromonas sp.]|nr:hypothetical protein [Polaromonas sp.]
MNNYEAAQIGLNNLITDTVNLKDFNEATARFRIIDQILTQIFGWDRLSMTVEKHNRGDFTDYECGSPVRLLVEAKRESIGFELPVNLNKNVLKLDTLFENNQAFKEAVEQAIGYCQKRGIPYAAVTNGRQWVFLLGARLDGISSEKGKCVVYSSLAHLYENFREAWDLVTPVALAEGNLQKILTKTVSTPPPRKLSARLQDYPGYKSRNPIATELQILGGLFFDDIINAPEIE